jgi:phage terminase Nu1 subunit (DNA packaging protein)
MSELIDLAEKATQGRFGLLVGVSQQAISERVNAGVLAEGGTFRDWLLAYCDRLRLEAAGRSGDDNQSLTRARTREAEASANLKQLQILEKTGALVPAAEVEPRYNAMITAARTELLSLSEKHVQQIKALYGVDVDQAIFDDAIHAALTHLASGLLADLDDHDAPGGEEMGAAA